MIGQRTAGWTRILISATVLVASIQWTGAQDTRAGAIARQQQEKAGKLAPEEPDRVEQIIKQIEEGGWFFSPNPKGLYPYLDSVYPGSGLGLGAGYRSYFGDYAFAEARGLYSLLGYKLVEFRSLSPEHAGGRLDLETGLGWRDATQIPFYGLGQGSSKADVSNFRIQETFVNGAATFRPNGRFRIRAGTGYSRYAQKPGEGTTPSVEESHGGSGLAGLGGNAGFLHSEISAGVFWVPAEGYARTGGLYRYSFHDYRNLSGDLNSFQLTRGELVQHIPIHRETWVLSVRARTESVLGKGDQPPFYLLPWLGSGTTLRGYPTGRWRDRNALLTSVEWRWIPSRYFLDAALFWDAGTVAPRFGDLRLSELKHDFGIGIRFHGPSVTAFRTDLAKGSEGWRLVFSVGAPF